MDEMAMLQQLIAMSQGGESKQTSKLELRAGRLTLKGATVTADPQRGTLVLKRQRSGEVHLQWLTRPGGKIKLDCMLVPEMVEWEGPIEECKDGRVYIMRWKDGSKKKYFFWMQEVEEKTDKEAAETLRKWLSGEKSTGESKSDLYASLLGERKGLMGESLVNILKPARVLAALKGDEDKVDMKALAPHLPKSQSKEGDLRTHLYSPHFRQTLSRLSAMLNSQNFFEVLASFQLDMGKGDIGVKAFLEIIETEVAKEKSKDDQGSSGGGDGG